MICALALAGQLEVPTAVPQELLQSMAVVAQLEMTCEQRQTRQGAQGALRTAACSD